jgi:proteic killer suppression protein
MRFSHPALQRLYDRGDARRLPPDLVPRIRRMLTALDEATVPRHVDLPGWRLHPMKGSRSGQWSLRVSANWRLVFRFDEGEAVDLIDYH